MFEMMDRGIKITRSNMETYNDMLWDRITELEEHNESLTELNNFNDQIINELQKALDNSEKDHSNLRDRLMELENEVDYMKNGKMNSDREELY